MYDVADPNHTLPRDDPVVLDVREHVGIGFRIRTIGVDVEAYDEKLTVLRFSLTANSRTKEALAALFRSL